MANEKISVVTVVLNAVGSIEKCVASVFAQTYDNIEYLVVDGGSTDGTLDILARYRDRIDYLVSEPDRGLYHAMNKGIQAATGDFVYFLNSDDRFCNETVVADVVEAIRQNPSVDLVYGDVLMGSGNQLMKRPQVPVLSRESLCRKGFCHQSLFARRELLLRTGGFSEEYRIVADGDWLARALAVGATSLHLDRDIAVFALDGVSGTSRWHAEKRRSLRANFTRWELLRWRKLPGLFGRK
ncbi:MAG: glycosyltransferase family 2 protein [Anderseniella sp.]|jgi:glycosyltransferase involved in cell wall biosynthesis|nr:glycosyltransferase family 2 protein [Anderseniella sp.]